MNKYYDYIDANKDKLLKDISSWIQIPSITGTKEAKIALDWIMEYAKKDGFKIAYTKSKRAGHIEIGPIENGIIGVLGHVDVVPVYAKEWKEDPFGGKIDGKYIYGRGTQDDKGPMLMAYYGLKALLESGFKPNKGIRFIFGTQEEGGSWDDIEEYFEQFEEPDFGFTPDADFPIIFAEKGICRVEISGKFDNYEKINVKSGIAINSVPALCTIFKDGVKNEFKGIPTHAKDAHKADSASYKGLEFILNNSTNDFLKDFSKTFAFDPLGNNININHRTDEEGDLTINLGLLRISEQGDFSASFDIRWPQGSSHQKVLKGFSDFAKNYNMEAKIFDSTDPKYLPQDHEGIIILNQAYRDATGDNETNLLTTGGGTYARTFTNCVAFGPLFPDDNRTLHQKDERADIANLIKATKVYANAFVKLLK